MTTLIEGILDEYSKQHTYYEESGRHVINERYKKEDIIPAIYQNSQNNQKTHIENYAEDITGKKGTVNVTINNRNLQEITSPLEI